LKDAGFAIWWGDSSSNYIYIYRYDISGATVYTFCTSGGGGIEKSISDLQQLYLDVNIVELLMG